MEQEGDAAHTGAEPAAGRYPMPTGGHHVTVGTRDLTQVKLWLNHLHSIFAAAQDIWL